MKLSIEIDFDAIADNPATEAGRILRYWAGALGQMDLSTVAEHPLMNSTYDAQVGSIRLTAD